MYTMMLAAVLATGMDTPDLGHRRGGGCCGGCYGGGCYGGGGGCYGGGCYGGGGGCYGGPGRGYAGGGYGGTYAWGSVSPWGGYVYPSLSYDPNFNTPMAAGPMYGDSSTRQSFYFNPGPNEGPEAMILVHLPADAKLTIDGNATQSTSGTRMFTSPPLERGKTYHYTLRGKVNRDGREFNAKKIVEVRAGRTSEVTLDFPDLNTNAEQRNSPTPPDGETPGQKPVPPGDLNKPQAPREQNPPPLP
jgi:uncharacterized protein (TIGR03000 family)